MIAIEQRQQQRQDTRRAFEAALFARGAGPGGESGPMEVRAFVCVCVCVCGNNPTKPLFGGWVGWFTYIHTYELVSVSVCVAFPCSCNAGASRPPADGRSRSGRGQAVAHVGGLHVREEEHTHTHTHTLTLLTHHHALSLLYCIASRAIHSLASPNRSAPTLTTCVLCVCVCVCVTLTTTLPHHPQLRPPPHHRRDDPRDAVDVRAAQRGLPPARVGGQGPRGPAAAGHARRVVAGV